MDIGSPREQRFRWKPIEWRLSDGTKGSFTGETTFEADLLIGGEGDGMLYISYLEETFDGTSWQETGQICEVPEVPFQID
jgi:hypothetical protein